MIYLLHYGGMKRARPFTRPAERECPSKFPSLQIVTFLGIFFAAGRAGLVSESRPWLTRETVTTFIVYRDQGRTLPLLQILAIFGIQKFILITISDRL